MLEKRFKIRGLNSKSGRYRTLHLTGATRDDAVLDALILGLIEPLEIEEIAPDPATEAQLNYAKDLGLSIPHNPTKIDMISILKKKLEFDSDAGKDLKDYANYCKLFFSEYIGKKELYNLIFWSLQGDDKIAFFIFSVYRWVTDDRRGNLAIHPYRSLFYEFAAIRSNDVRFLNSMNAYSGEDIRFFGKVVLPDGNVTYGGSTNTIAYKESCSFIGERLGVSTAKKTHSFQPVKNRPKKVRKKVEYPVSNASHIDETTSGCSCLLVIVLAVIVMFAIYC